MTKLDSITVAQLEAQLDEQKPQWYLEWCDQVDLRDLAMGTLTVQALKTRVIHKLWPMLRAIYLLTLDK